MLWDDKRIQDEVTALDDMSHIHYSARNNIVVSLVKMRNEYEKRIAELDALLGVKKDHISQYKTLIAELEREVAELKNYIQERA